MNEVTTIQLQKETRERLKAFGNKDDTYDTILTKLMSSQKIDVLPKSTEQSIEERVDTKLSEKDQVIQHQLIELMKQHPNKTWLIQELVHNVVDKLEMNYAEVKKYLELLLSKMHDVENVDGFKIGDKLGYKLIE